MCYHAEFGRSALNDVGINTGEPQNWTVLELRTLGVADPKIHAIPHMCHHVKFDSAATNSLRISRRELQKLGSDGIEIRGNNHNFTM